MSVQYLQQTQEDYRRVEQAIIYIEENFRRQPSLDEIAQSVNLSSYHFHRLFKRWAGITPKQFLQFLTIGYAKQLLARHSVLDTSLEAGLSGPGRLHDLFVTFEAISPGEYKANGVGLVIKYGFHPTPFGDCLLAATDRGVCGLLFVSPDGTTAGLESLRQNWPRSTFEPDQSLTGRYVQKIFGQVSSQKETRLPLLVKGTNFQIKVWEALLKIPSGAVASYGQIAAGMGRPSASRAVANAVAHNPIGYVIPCHRVIRQTGSFGGYQWGAVRKKAMLVREAGRHLA